MTKITPGYRTNVKHVRVEQMTSAWTTRVTQSSHGLESSGYAHEVVVPGHLLPITIVHTWQQNYDHIHTEPLGDGYVRQTGIGRRKPDLTPHPLALLIAATPDLLAALESVISALDGRVHSRDALRALSNARAAIVKARGTPPTPGDGEEERS